MEIEQLRPQAEEEPIEEPVEEEEENELGIEDYLGHEEELGPDINPRYHSDPVFSDNSDSTFDFDPNETPTDELEGFLGAELRDLEEDVRRENEEATRRQEEEEAYLSALHDPLQADLFEGFGVKALQVSQEQPNQQLAVLPPLPEALPLLLVPTAAPQLQGAPPPPPPVIVATPQQQGISSVLPTLRRSRRISERGTTKRYTEERNKARKCDKAAFLEPDLDSAAQAALLSALRDEFHASNPLQQQVANQADIYCGIHQTGKDPIDLRLDQQVREIGGTSTVTAQLGVMLDCNTEGSSLAAKPTEQSVESIVQMMGVQEKPQEEEGMEEWMNGEYNMEENYEESVLGAFDSDSDLPLSDGEEDGPN